ncbi:c-type cytochrome [Castellaniella sp. FW104-16D08]|uniref:c-type cytochrome n=1 Tax=unclassified Castellaniella TaxID=2617606 RepID=UPI003314F5A1
MKSTTRPINCLLLLAGCLSLAVMSTAWADTQQDEGKKIYTQGAAGTPACATCHGVNAEGNAAASFPYLAGQGKTYLAEQLTYLADGTRESAIMKPMASALSGSQREAVAAYVSSLPHPWDPNIIATKADTYPAPINSGAWLANRGDWSRDVPACTQCHAAGGIGVGSQFPAIAGLSKNYIVAQFNLWKADKRPGGPGALMGNIAKRLTDNQIDVVASYFADLPQANQAANGAKK